MKKITICLVSLALALPLLRGGRLVYGVTSLNNLGDEIQKKVREQIKSTVGENKLFGTYSDPEYKNYSNQFNLGQRVYVRISLSSCDDQGNVVKLLDSEKQEMQTIALTKEISSPCVLSGSFDAPNHDGVFYLDAKITSSTGVNFAGQMNINVGKGGTYVSTSVQNKVAITGVPVTVTSRPKPTVTITPIVTQSLWRTVTGTPQYLPKSESFGARISGFFKRLFLLISGGSK